MYTSILIGFLISSMVKKYDLDFRVIHRFGDIAGGDGVPRRYTDLITPAIFISILTMAFPTGLILLLEGASMSSYWTSSSNTL